jgi:nitrous oxide reductase accessory protein NosL
MNQNCTNRILNLVRNFLLNTLLVHCRQKADIVNKVPTQINDDNYDNYSGMLTVVVKDNNIIVYADYHCLYLF